jgi:diadenosine tetraphosphatase ApaH/serine/threonine PP2A family protein phosphatase
MQGSLAVIADIHGNLLALEAVLADIAARGITDVINLGDCVSGPLWPAETCDRLMALGAPTVRGNHDRWVADLPEEQLGLTDRYTRGALGERHRAWLRALPARQVMPGILAVHGIPGDDNRYLLERVADFHLVLEAPDAIAARLGDAPSLVLCGHSHLPRLVRLPDGPTVLNPGSVGCPAYQDPSGEPHVSEAASPHARYAVVHQSGDAIGAELIAVEYDHRAASARAAALGRSDWAHALATGYAVPLSGRA